MSSHYNWARGVKPEWIVKSRMLLEKEHSTIAPVWWTEENILAMIAGKENPIHGNEHAAEKKKNPEDAEPGYERHAAFRRQLL
jgi:hypothetical protein